MALALVPVALATTIDMQVHSLLDHLCIGAIFCKMAGLIAFVAGVGEHCICRFNCSSGATSTLPPLIKSLTKPPLPSTYVWRVGDAQGH